MSMDTNKIREDLELLESVDVLNAERVAERICYVAANIRAELDKAQQPACGWYKCPHGSECVHAKAQQPGKVLTDEEVYKMSEAHAIGLVRNRVPRNTAEVRAIGYRDGMKDARDNGYLAPAAGLTVEEAYDIWRSFHFRHQNDGEQYMDYLDARNAAYRSRLTAAIEAKKNKP